MVPSAQVWTNHPPQVCADQVSPFQPLKDSVLKVVESLALSNSRSVPNRCAGSGAVLGRSTSVPTASVSSVAGMTVLAILKSPKPVVSFTMPVRSGGRIRDGRDLVSQVIQVGDGLLVLKGLDPGSDADRNVHHYQCDNRPKSKNIAAARDRRAR